MRRVLIAGCGYVGSELARLYAEAGDTVWGLRRNPVGLPPGVGPVAADLTDPASLGPLPEAPDLVCYCVAADGRDDAAYRRAYVDGIRNLLALLESRGERPRLVYVSSTGVYGQTDGSRVDEASPTEPPGFTGRRLLEGERLALDAGGTVMRFGGIYGPDRTRLIDGVRLGRPMRPVGPPLHGNRIHRDDCAGSLRHVLGLPEPAPVYVGVDRDQAPIQEVVDWLAAELGVPTPPSRAGESDPGSMRGNKRCSSELLVASGYRFLYPSYREGYRALIAAA